MEWGVWGIQLQVNNVLSGSGFGAGVYALGV